jgi:hypothetical protein
MSDLILRAVEASLVTNARSLDNQESIDSGHV